MDSRSSEVEHHQQGKVTSSQAPKLWEHLHTIGSVEQDLSDHLSASIRHHPRETLEYPLPMPVYQGVIQPQVIPQPPSQSDLQSKSFSSPAQSAPLHSAQVTDLFYGLKPARITLNEVERDNQTSGASHPSQIQQSDRDFILHQVLGEGGMGRVYAGIQTCLNRDVALKVSKHKGADPRLRAQVSHEAQVTAMLDHPNILPIYLLAVDERDQPVQVMKKISGVSWHELIYEPEHEMWSKLEVESQEEFHLDVLSQVCLAMGYAHQKGVIHRDLKPENVMVGSFGEVYVLDWGVAIVLDAIGVDPSETPFQAQVQCQIAEALVGTPAYMAPEMARCDVESYGPPCDVYLLGAMLYEILCGWRIRDATEIKPLFRQILSGALIPPSPDLTDDFLTLLKLSLSPDPLRRPYHALEFRRLLIKARQSSKGALILKRACEKAILLKESIEANSDFTDLAAHYDEARLSYRTCLELSPMNIRARRELDDLHSLWAHFLIDEDELKIAAQIIALRFSPDQPLNQRLAQAQCMAQGQERERLHLKEWRAEESISLSHPLRIKFSILGLFIFGFGSLGLDYLVRSGQMVIDARGEFLAMGLLSTMALTCFLALTLRRRRLGDRTNAIFQRLAIHLIIILMMVSIHRLICWQTGLSVEQLIHNEMPLLALGCFGMSAISKHRDFTFGALMFSGAALISLSLPQWTTLIYAIAMTSLWLGVLWVWAREDRGRII